MAFPAPIYVRSIDFHAHTFAAVRMLIVPGGDAS